MDIVVDYLLLAASGAACLYCFMLNRRLRDLTKAKGGLGAGVAALTHSADEMKAALAQSRKSAELATTRLAAALADADAKAEALRALVDELDGISMKLSEHAEGATRKYVDALAPMLDEATTAADRLFAAIEAAPVAKAQKPARAGVKTPKSRRAPTKVAA